MLYSPSLIVWFSWLKLSQRKKVSCEERNGCNEIWNYHLWKHEMQHWLMHINTKIHAHVHSVTLSCWPISSFKRAAWPFSGGLISCQLGIKQRFIEISYLGAKPTFKQPCAMHTARHWFMPIWFMLNQLVGVCVLASPV